MRGAPCMACFAGQLVRDMSQQCVLLQDREAFLRGLETQPESVLRFSPLFSYRTDNIPYGSPMLDQACSLVLKDVHNPLPALINTLKRCPSPQSLQVQAL